jgi:hypothetical protein
MPTASRSPLYCRESEADARMAKALTEMRLGVWRSTSPSCQPYLPQVQMKELVTPKDHHPDERDWTRREDRLFLSLAAAYVAIFALMLAAALAFVRMCHPDECDTAKFDPPIELK